MTKTISLNKVRVLKFAGLLVLAAIAVVFLALPMVSFAKGGGMGGQTLQAGDAFNIASSDGTSTKDPSFKAATSPVPSDGVELVTVTVKGTQTFALFLGKGKGELIVNGKATAVKLK